MVFAAALLATGDAVDAGVLASATAAAFLVGRRSARGWRPKLRPVFSIDVYEGDSPFTLRASRTGDRPALRREDVTDVRARFVADPFMLRRGGTWHMIFEVYNAERGMGEIALATSDDLRAWNYRGVILREPFHVTYPYVFEHDGEVYMLPETNRANSLRLYRADPFPRRWKLERTLMSGPHHDASMFAHGGRWWILACNSLRHDSLSLYMSDDPRGAWTEHRLSPLTVGDRGGSRPAGRVLHVDGRLYRFAQDARPRYGTRVWAFEITRLDAYGYEERPVQEAPVLMPSGRGWNAQGMHHVDAHPTEDGRWVACVDGWRDHVFLGRWDVTRLAGQRVPGARVVLQALRVAARS